MTSTIKKQRAQEITTYHKEVLMRNGCPNGKVTPKLVYVPKGMKKKCIKLFESDFRAKQTLFIEFTDADNNPVDTNRTLYKLQYNPHYAEEYTKEPTSDSDFSYLVPIEDLIKVSRTTSSTMEQVVNSSSVEFPLPDANSDQPFNQMTIRDFVAIFHKKPVSSKDWLNNLINKING